MKTDQHVKRDKLALVILLGLLASFLIGCHHSGGGDPAAKKDASPYPGTEAGARALLGEFRKSGADHKALSKQLQPTSADYSAVFDADFAKKAEATYAAPWDRGEMVVAPKPGQTELLLASATSDDLKKWNDKAQEFPGGYKDVAARFKDGITLYRFKFVEPGKDLGMAFDGLVYVNGQWRIFPKPWRIGG